MRLEGTACRLTDFLSHVLVGEQLGKSGGQFGGRIYLDRATEGKHAGYQCLEVLHMRSDYGRNTQAGGFGWILPALGEKTLADNDDSSQCLPVHEFTGRVNEEAVGAGGAFESVTHGGQLTAQCDLKAELL